MANSVYIETSIISYLSSRVSRNLIGAARQQTWNCKHIANPEIQKRIASYLEEQELFLPFICTPDELLGANDE